MSVNVEKYNTINNKTYIKIISRDDVISKIAILSLSNQISCHYDKILELHSIVIGNQLLVKEFLTLHLADSNNVVINLLNSKIILLSRYDINERLYSCNDIRVEIQVLNKSILNKL